MSIEKNSKKCAVLWRMRLVLLPLLLLLFMPPSALAEDVAVITAFDNAGEQLAALDFTPDSDINSLLACMPTEISVTLADGSVQSIAVSWRCLGDFQNTDDYYYDFVPEWDHTLYALSADIDPERDVPFVLVQRSETDNAAAEDVLTEAESYAKAASNSNSATIYQFLLNNIGVNSAAACGILANIECESSFNPNVWGDAGTSYGICQWHNGRLAAMQNWCSSNGYDWKTLTGQLYYLKKELSEDNSNYLHNGKTVKEQLLHMPNTRDGAYQAGWYWCYYYEIPANKESVSVSRGNKAKTYWDNVGSSSADFVLLYATANVNVRASKSTSSTILTTLKKGSELYAAPTGDGWCRMLYNKTTGYVKAEYTTASNATPVTKVFSDLQASSWYVSPIQFAYSLNIMKGTSNSIFEPATFCTRAMGVTLLYRLSGAISGLALKKTGSAGFSDVSTGKWYTDSISWANANQLVSGMGNNQFLPGNNVTREQFAVMLRNYAAALGKNTSVSASMSQFSDTSGISSYAKTAMQWAVGKGIITGSGGKLLPKTAMSRAEAAAMLQRFVNALN